MAISKARPVVGGLAHLIQRGHGALAGEIDDEVARDGKEPSVEAGFAVVLAAAQQDAHPGLLEEVFGDLALAGQEQQIAKQAVLVEFDEAIQQFGILALQAVGDGCVFTLASLCLFRRDGDRRTAHKGKDAKTHRKVSVGGALFSAK